MSCEVIGFLRNCGFLQAVLLLDFYHRLAPLCKEDREDGRERHCCWRGPGSGCFRIRIFFPRVVLGKGAGKGVEKVSSLLLAFYC